MSDVTHSTAPQNDAPDFVVIDVETACSRVSSICQIGIVGFKNGREIFEYETLLDPRDIFEVFNTRIHGIAEHHVVGQPTFADVHAIVHGHLSGRTTVAHSYFDKGALAAACRVHDRAMIETTWLDSVRVAKRAWPDLESHRLGLLARYLGITHKHHDALSDARAAGWVIVKASEHTGLSLNDWLAPPRVAGPAPAAAADGPLKGDRVVILGEPRDGKLAHIAAGLGARNDRGRQFDDAAGGSRPRAIRPRDPVERRLFEGAGSPRRGLTNPDHRQRRAESDRRQPPPLILPYRLTPSPSGSHCPLPPWC
ncbi:exonuclease domain-containing protein [Sphingomonas sp. LR55]|uniref:exonuclease domain-containing protein n=1 Tax=Sphingomonas sp. LR55 TaxID=3050231 RepID=UPI002FE01962